MLQLWFIANTVLWQPSVKLGGISLSLNVVLLMIVGSIWLIKKRTIALSSVHVLLVFFVFLVFSFLVALNGQCHDHLQKAFLTIPILFALALIGLETGRRASNIDWIKLQTTALWTLMIGLSALIVEFLAPSWFPATAGYRAEGKLSGIFHEPSHNAFSLFPCITLLLAADSRTIRRFGMFGLVSLLILSRSSTLISLFAAWAVYRLLTQRNVRTSFLLAGGIVFLFSIGAAINYDRFITPTIERVVGVASLDETSNVSSLVYVQGWEDTVFNLWQTHSLGLGFNMMGCGPLPDVPARIALHLLSPVELNAEDGSFLFAKMVSEAGVIGVAFYVLVVWLWIKLETRLRNCERGAARSSMTAQSAIILCFVASSFIRGAGYFSGGLLLWICAVGGMSVRHPSLSVKLPRSITAA